MPGVRLRAARAVRAVRRSAAAESSRPAARAVALRVLEPAERHRAARRAVAPLARAAAALRKVAPGAAASVRAGCRPAAQADWPAAARRMAGPAASGRGEPEVA